MALHLAMLYWRTTKEVIELHCNHSIDQ